MRSDVAPTVLRDQNPAKMSRVPASQPAEPSSVNPAVRVTSPATGVTPSPVAAEMMRSCRSPGSTATAVMSSWRVVAVSVEFARAPR
jgi:hypothetical protein